MSRSGYTDDCDDTWSHIRWRGAVASATKGKRGQQLLKELLESLDAMPEKRLVAEVLEAEGEVCALGALGRKREIPMTVDPEDYDAVASIFGVAPALVQEIVWHNDEFEDEHCVDGRWVRKENLEEQRWQYMRNWVANQIIKE